MNQTRLLLFTGIQQVNSNQHKRSGARLVTCDTVLRLFTIQARNDVLRNNGHVGIRVSDRFVLNINIKGMQSVKLICFQIFS